ncbi:MAG: TIGR04283 family arsenosugar biosynthesis glycosyltransferase [Nitrospirae bacterium]|nr:TIGR04283 family arsenosugar biosynthesis glycosyltransferase [Nitrospirota bacterium]
MDSAGKPLTPVRFPCPRAGVISVIIPTLNEEDRIRRCIEGLLGGGGGCEIIVADGGSSDRTREFAESYPGVAVVLSERGRGVQMNAGARAASGEVLVFLHADTLLEAGWTEELISVLKRGPISGGAFTFSIRSPLWKFRLVEAWVKLRVKLCCLPYGDQAIFVRKSAFELIGGYKNIPLMEDVDFIGRLKETGPVVILDKKAATSARRWSKKGLVTTAAINQCVMLLYRCGAAPGRLARIYYR